MTPTPRMASKLNSDLFRQLPSIDELLRVPALQHATQSFGHAATLEAARTLLDDLRRKISAGSLDQEALAAAVAQGPLTIEQQLNDSQNHSLRPVINATGVILHTNLGRAPLSEAALQRVVEVARGYSNLEFDLASGERGERDVHVSRLFAKLLSTSDPRSQPSWSTTMPPRCCWR